MLLIPLFIFSYFVNNYVINKFHTKAYEVLSGPDNTIFRRPITITNSSTETLNDFQISFTLDTATLISNGKLRYDCGDIRFTYSDNVTTLSYWIEPNSDGSCNGLKQFLSWK